MTTVRHRHNGPIFIVGMNGSGTTMMLDHLAHHPKIFGFRLETYILPHYLMRESKYKNLAEDNNFLRLWNDMRGEYAFRRGNKGRVIDLPSDWAMVARNPAGVFDRIMREFALREGKERWCEKTPMYALHISKLAVAYPAASFIHMVRDGRDCAASNVRRWGRHPESTVYRWKQVVAEARRQGKLVRDRYMELRYEDLTESPEPYMRAACEFLLVEFDDRVLIANRPRPRMPGKGSQTIVKNRNSNAGYLPAETIKALERIAGKQLAYMGYSTELPEGDLNPRYARLWWFAHDAVAVFARQLKAKLTFQKRMTWTLFFARLKATLRQARSASLGSVKDSRDQQ